MKLSDFIARCSDKNVFVVPGTAFLPNESEPTRSFRLNYSMPTDDEIENGIKIIAQVIESLR